MNKLKKIYDNAKAKTVLFAMEFEDYLLDKQRAQQSAGEESMQKEDTVIENVFDLNLVEVF